MTGKRRSIALLLLIGLMAVLLSGCGGPKGTYIDNSGYVSTSVTFDGKNIRLSAFGMNLNGTYKIKGNQLEIQYELFGAPMTETMTISKSGNTVTINGEVFTKDSESSGNVVLAIILIVVIAAGIVFFLMRARRGQMPKPDLSELGSKVSRTSKNLYGSASVTGGKIANQVSKGVSASIAAGKAGYKATKAAAKNYQANRQSTRYSKTSGELEDEWEEAPLRADDWEEVPSQEAAQYDEEEWEEADESDEREAVGIKKDDDDEWEEVSPPRIYQSKHAVPSKKASPVATSVSHQPEPQEFRSAASTQIKFSVRTDRCCICGKDLSGGYTRLASLPSGEEARIDRDCHQRMYVLANSSDSFEFEDAAGFIKRRVPYMDPRVANAMRDYVESAEKRMYGDFVPKH